MASGGHSVTTGMDKDENMSSEIEILHLRGDHMTLDALLKASGWASSGGYAKQLILAGELRVNGEVETRRGRKLRAGDEVQFGAQSLRLSAAQVGSVQLPDPSNVAMSPPSEPKASLMNE